MKYFQSQPDDCIAHGSQSCTTDAENVIIYNLSGEYVYLLVISITVYRRKDTHTHIEPFTQYSFYKLDNLIIIKNVILFIKNSEGFFVDLSKMYTG